MAARESDDDPLPHAQINPGEGTSFAVAGTAGVAALWLAHNNLDRYTHNGPYLQDLFASKLRRTVTRPPHWPQLHGDFGEGVVNAEALLKSGSPSATGDPSVIRETTLPVFLGRTFDLPDRSVKAALTRLFQDSGMAFEISVQRYGHEFAYQAIRRPDAFIRTVQTDAKKELSKDDIDALLEGGSNRLTGAIRKPATEAPGSRDTAAGDPDARKENVEN